MSSDDASSNKPRRIGESQKQLTLLAAAVWLKTATDQHFDKTNTIDVSQNLAESK